MKAARLIPSVGTLVPLKTHTVVNRGENHTPSMRIVYDAKTDTWEQSLGPAVGLLVFLNNLPQDTDTHLVINSIMKTGKAAWGDTIKV